jgi:hypothetical protein
MTRDGHLGRLLALRQRNEQRALDAFTRSQQACEGARTDVATARQRVARQAEDTRAAERGIIGAWLGHPVSAADLRRFQTECEASSVAAGDLRAAAATAQARLDACKQELEATRNAHLACQRATQKLDLMTKREAADAARRELALAEAVEEDRLCRRAAETSNPAAM